MCPSCPSSSPGNMEFSSFLDCRFQGNDTEWGWAKLLRLHSATMFLLGFSLQLGRPGFFYYLRGTVLWELQGGWNCVGGQSKFSGPPASMDWGQRRLGRSKTGGVGKELPSLSKACGMKAAFFTGTRRIEILPTEEPRLEAARQVRVRVERVGICGSDVHYYLHGRIGDQLLQYPASLGHECAGRVVEVGPAVQRLKVGDPVAIDPAIVCGQCDQCLAGRPNTCRQLRFLGGPGEAPGAAREYLVLPEENCFPLPAGLTLDHAVLAEPLSIGLYGVRLARLTAQERVAILGCGPIGLSVLVWVKLLAGCRVYATDLLDERLAAAQRCGAEWIGNARRQETTGAILQAEPLGIDCVFECSGDAACVAEGIRLAKPGGRILWVGIPPETEVLVPAHLARRKEITIQLVRRQRGCIPPVLDAMAQGQLDVRWWITHRYPLEQIDQAFELAAHYGDGLLKAILHLPE